MTAFFGALVALLLLLVVLLAIPAKLYFSLSWPLMANNALRLHWLFGLVNLHLPIKHAGHSAGKKQNSNHQVKKRTPAKRKSSPRRDSLAQNRTLLYPMLRFAIRCWQSIEKYEVHLKLRVGLGDPADTGRLFGIVAPLVAVFSQPNEVNVEMVPEFDESVVEVESDGGIGFVPLQLIGLFAYVLIIPAVWRAIR